MGLWSCFRGRGCQLTVVGGVGAVRVACRAQRQGASAGAEVREAALVNEADWEQRVADAWASIDQRSEAEFLALIEQLVTELPADSGMGGLEGGGPGGAA